MQRASLLPIANLLASAVTPTRAYPLRNAAFRAAGVSVDRRAVINGNCHFIGPEVVVGRSWIGMGCWIISNPQGGVFIGDNCDLGPQVLIATGSHAIGARMRRAGAGTASPTTIQDGCWIGARVLILGGVTVGTGSIVAAGAVVTGDVAPNSLVAGVPAGWKKDL